MKYLGKRHDFGLRQDINLANRLRSSNKSQDSKPPRRAKSISNKMGKKKVRNVSKSKKSAKSASTRNQSKNKFFRFQPKGRRKIPLANMADQLGKLAEVKKTGQKTKQSKIDRLKKLKDVAIKTCPADVTRLEEPEIQDQMVKKLKVTRKIKQVEQSIVTLEENGREKSFFVIDDYDLNIPKKIQRMLNLQKMDDDNETTESLIERAIYKVMDNVCYSLKQMNATNHDFTYYMKKKESEQSNSSTFTRRRKCSWSHTESLKNQKKMKRTRSVKARRTFKKVKPKKKRSKSIGRLQRVSKQLLSNLT